MIWPCHCLLYQLPPPNNFHFPHVCNSFQFFFLLYRWRLYIAIVKLIYNLHTPSFISFFLLAGHRSWEDTMYREYILFKRFKSEYLWMNFPIDFLAYLFFINRLQSIYIFDWFFSFFFVVLFCLKINLLEAWLIQRTEECAHIKLQFYLICSDLWL